ncbi:unnamed protein product [marine sediment metagenome]|uniref:Uncharacterized protein n=1 Tax=marine sediment metagenome TaxID=412755 RepID=X1R1A2_9ZZZZ
MELTKLKGEGPERIKIDMVDPLFAAGDSRTAVAPITISPAGLSCGGELYLGPDEVTKVATSGLVPFVSTGLGLAVRLPVIMPSPGGFAYHVYLDVYANGILLVAYIATEDVIVPYGEVGPITWE